MATDRGRFGRAGSEWCGRASILGIRAYPNTQF